MYKSRSNRSGHETKYQFKMGKEYVMPIQCHPAYLTFMHYTSREMPGWMNKLESKLPGEISKTTDMQMTPPLWQNVKKN